MSLLETQPSIRIFLLMKNRLLREALKRLCRKRAELLVMGEAAYRDSLVPEVLERQYDVLAMDFLDRRFLAALYPAYSRDLSEFKIILIDMENDAQQFLESVRAGVLGYLLKDASGSEVISAIAAISRQEVVCPPRLCATLFHYFAQTPCQPEDRTEQPGRDLTLRQRQLVNLVAKGLTNKEIAAQLNLSAFTVRNHIHRILKQVEASSRQEAVRVVRAQGFTAAL